MDGVPHKTDPDGDPNVFELKCNEDGLWLNDNWAKPSNEWNPDNKFVFRLRNCFLSAVLEVAVFLFGVFQTFLPPAEHLADLLEFQGDIFTIFVRYNLSFPRYGNEKFQGIQNQDTFGNSFRFLVFFCKISEI